MLLISPRSHCVSNGAVSGKQGTKSGAAVTMRAVKGSSGSLVSCEILTDVADCVSPAHPPGDLGPGHQAWPAGTWTCIGNRATLP